MEPQAQLFYNVLEAIFDYADNNIEPKGLGVMTNEKEAIMLEKANVPEILAVHKLIPASVLSEVYRIAGCQMYMVPSYDADASPYVYREPSELALTKAGWIKYQVIYMACEDANKQEYEILQGYVTNYELQIKDPSDRARFDGGRYMPFPEIQTVEWYAKSLASALGFEGIKETIQSLDDYLQDWVSQLQEKSRPSPGPTGMAEEQLDWETNMFIAQQQQRMDLQIATMMADSAAANARSMARAFECTNSGIF